MESSKTRSSGLEMLKAAKGLTIAEIEKRRSRITPAGVSSELVWIVEICWAGVLPKFLRIDILENLLTSGTPKNKELLYVRIATEVICLDCSSAELITVLESFLKTEGDLQNRVLMDRARITDIPNWRVDYMDIRHPFNRAAQLAADCKENRQILIESLVEAAWIFISSKFGREDKKSVDEPASRPGGSRASKELDSHKRLAVLQEFGICTLADWLDEKKAVPAIRKLHESGISVPYCMVENEFGKTEKQVRKESWLKLIGKPPLREMLWRKSLRRLYSPRKAKVRNKPQRPRIIHNDELD